MPANRRWPPWQGTLGAGALLIVFALIFKRVALRDDGDDQFFLHALNDRSLLEFLEWRYQTWSGRTLIEGLIVSTIGFSPAWKLGIPTAFIGAGYCIWRLTLSARLPPIPGTLAVVVLMTLIGRAVRVDAVFWVTGFYNYLLPSTLGLLALVVLQSATLRSRLLYPVALPCTIACCQTEQGALAMLTVLVALVVTRRSSQQSCRAEVVLLAGGMLAALALVLAPGNQVRHAVELRWLPEFAEMGLVEKLALGLDRINAHAHNPRNFLLPVIAGFAAWVTWTSCRTIPARAACTILALYLASVLAAAAMRNLGMVGGPGLFGIRDYLSPQEWMRGGIFVSYGLTIGVFGALAVCAVSRARNPADRLAGLGLPLLAVLSTMLLSLSPTIYASTARVLFVGDLLLVVYFGRMLSDHLDARRSRFVEAGPPAGGHSSTAIARAGQGDSHQ